MPLLTFTIAALSIAQPVPGSRFANLDDYPKSALNKRVQGRTDARVTVSEAGEAIDCMISKSSGSRELDAATCAVARRIRYRPAIDDTGQPLVSVIRNVTQWTLPGQRPSGPGFQADVRLEVGSLPIGTKSPALMAVNLLVAPDGTITACDSASSGNFPKSFIDAACAQSRSVTTLPANDSKGQPVRSVQGMIVEFVAK